MDALDVNCRVYRTLGEILIENDLFSIAYPGDN